jgi:anti-sigma regulatory factor (Ser/Thr protein kinase)
MNRGAVDRHQRAFASAPVAARAARVFVASILQQAGAPDQVIQDFRLVVSELAANIVEHGDGSGFEVFVDAGTVGSWTVGVGGSVAAADTSLPALEAWAVAGTDEVSGRGLGIVRELMDDIVVDNEDGWISVCCTQRRPEV